MRGSDVFMESLFTMATLEDFVPSEHPLRPIREMVNAALKRLDELFDRMYAAPELGGRPSIAPEKLLRAMLLQVFYSIRSERQLMEQVQYNLLFRWFMGLSMDDAVWTPTVFTKNRERLIDHEAVVALFNEVLAIAASRDWLSGEHFSVDGTLIQAWAGHKSFVRKDGRDDDEDPGDFRGTRRSNETHAFTTDPEARLYRVGRVGFGDDDFAAFLGLDSLEEDGDRDLGRLARYAIKARYGQVMGSCIVEGGIPSALGKTPPVLGA